MVRVIADSYIIIGCILVFLGNGIGRAVRNTLNRCGMVLRSEYNDFISGVVVCRCCAVTILCYYRIVCDRIRA